MARLVKFLLNISSCNSISAIIWLHWHEDSLFCLLEKKKMSKRLTGEEKEGNGGSLSVSGAILFVSR